MSQLWTFLSGFGFGVGSSIVPLFNAEAYLVATVASHPWLVAALVLALALGQTGGKMILFEAAHRGSTRVMLGRRATPEKFAAAHARLTETLGQRRRAVPLVFVSASLGLPPLALVSVASEPARWREPPSP